MVYYVYVQNRGQVFRTILFGSKYDSPDNNRFTIPLYLPKIESTGTGGWNYWYLRYDSSF